MSAPLWSSEGLTFQHGAAAITVPPAQVAAGQTLTIVFETIDQAHLAARLIVGFDLPKSGRVTLLGLDTAIAPRDAMLRARRNLGFAAAHPAFLSTVPLPENVLIPLRDRMPGSEDAAAKRSTEFLAKLGVVFTGRVLPQQASAAIAYLSGIARALAPEPELAVIEEPPAELTAAQLATFRAVIAERARTQRGAMILLVADTMTGEEVPGIRIDATVRHQ